MSRENVAVARAAWAAYKDYGIDAASDYFADDCVIEDFAQLPDRATYMGKDGLRERYWHFVDSWGDFDMEPLEFIDAGSDAVVAVIAMTGKGKGGGVPVDAPAAFACEFRGGEVIRDRAFTSRGEALKAVGFQE